MKPRLYAVRCEATWLIDGQCHEDGPARETKDEAKAAATRDGWTTRHAVWCCPAHGAAEEICDE